jgi:hypothetical protein
MAAERMGASHPNSADAVAIAKVAFGGIKSGSRGET